MRRLAGIIWLWGAASIIDCHVFVDPEEKSQVSMIMLNDIADEPESKVLATCTSPLVTWYYKAEIKEPFLHAIPFEIDLLFQSKFLHLLVGRKVDFARHRFAFQNFFGNARLCFNAIVLLRVVTKTKPQWHRHYDECSLALNMTQLRAIRFGNL